MFSLILAFFLFFSVFSAFSTQVAHLPQIHIIPYPKNEYMFVYLTCNNSSPSNFNFNSIGIPTYELSCSNLTNQYDCNEAVPYLNFMIHQYYHPLARVYFFSHGHEFSWHLDRSILTTINRYVHSKCTDSLFPFGGFSRNFLYNREISKGRLPGEPPHVYDDLAYNIFKNTSIPQKQIIKNNVYPCCSTFYVGSNMIRNRPLSDYIQIRDHLREWSKKHITIPHGPAYFCGRIMEYYWHILFTGNPHSYICSP